MPSPFNQLFRFHKNYFLLFLFFLFTEIFIAVFVHDNFVRPYAGDYLVVMLLYCFVKGFFVITDTKAALLVLLFSFAVEGSQYLDLVNRLHLQNSKVARTILGSSFEWKDLLCYVLGLLTVLLLERVRKNRVRTIA